MSLAAKLLSASGGMDKLYADDVFSAYTYTGNGSTQTINNGIDLLGKGGLVWTKVRSTTYAPHLIDTTRGTTQGLSTNNMAAQISTTTDFSSFSSTGYALGAPASTAHYNSSGATYVSWTFRKAPKFFDVVTYTGNGASSRAIAHLLGQEVGMVMTKATSTAGDWNTYHRSATGDLALNTTAVQTGSKALVNSATTSTFTVSGAANTNAVTYVAYLFAHDSSADGIVQCGSFTANGGIQNIDIGFEPQLLITKNVSATGDWYMCDAISGWGADGKINFYRANTSNAQQVENGSNYLGLQAKGFHTGITSTGIGFANGNTVIYLAIRRSNKPPTTGTEVYNAIARAGADGTATVTGVGFAADLVWFKHATGSNGSCYDRLRGIKQLLTQNLTAAEGTVSAGAGIQSINMDGVSLGTNWDGENLGSGALNIINHFFKRAPGVFDQVCYTGTGLAGRVLNHSLSAPPELAIFKHRNGSGSNWWVWVNGGLSSTGGINGLQLNAGVSIGFNVAYVSGSNVFTSEPSSTQLSIRSIGADGDAMNVLNNTYVAYLFATKAGISKVGSYTGNGTSQTIDCGFTTGARFVLIKRTDAAGDWYVWDTVRGLVAGNDPHLSLNSTTAEITTDDSLDPTSVGFIVNQLAATNINVTSASYIYLSFA